MLLGILLHHSGNVVWRFLGPVEASNSNEAEMFPMLVGYRELLNLVIKTLS